MTAVLLIICWVTQSGSGTIFGTVTNAADSQSVAGATVNLWRSDSCVALMTDSLGCYRAAVPAGHYTVIACASDGRTAGGKVSVQPGQEVSLDLRVAVQEPIPRLMPSSEPVPGLPPVKSDIRMYEHGGDLMDVERMLAITQVGDSILVQSIGPRPCHRWLEPTWGGPYTKVGLVPVAEFRVFWDSLDQLGLWHLQDQYSDKSLTMGEMSGHLSVKFQESGQNEVSKTVRFHIPGTCPPEFGRAYDLIWSMARFAQSAPDSLKDTGSARPSLAKTSLLQGRNGDTILVSVEEPRPRLVLRTSSFVLALVYFLYLPIKLA